MHCLPFNKWVCNNEMRGDVFLIIKLGERGGHWAWFIVYFPILGIKNEM